MPKLIELSLGPVLIERQRVNDVTDALDVQGLEPISDRNLTPKAEFEEVLAQLERAPAVLAGVVPGCVVFSELTDSDGHADIMAGCTDVRQALSFIALA